MNKTSYGSNSSSGYGRSYGDAGNKRALTTGSSSYGGKDDHVSGHNYDNHGSYRTAIPARYARRSYGGVGLDRYGGYGSEYGRSGYGGYGSSGYGGYGSSGYGRGSSGYGRGGYGGYGGYGDNSSYGYGSQPSYGRSYGGRNGGYSSSKW